MNGLLTDLYQLTMAAGYFEAGKAKEYATFELFVRRLPPNRAYVLAAGLAQAVDYLLGLKFTDEEIDYLRGLPQFARVSPEFFGALRKFRFTGDVFACPEGTPLFAGEPMLTVRAPILEAQIPETYLLSTLGFQSMVATKAARMVEAAGGRNVVEFGTRRAHSPEAGLLAARSAYIGGCVGTSNTLAGLRYGVPVYGTTAHSWILSFPSELQAFKHLQKLFGEGSVYLVDTFDTLEGTRLAASLGKPIWGIRLDSGNLAELLPKVRAILDDAELGEARIMVTGDLNEHKILELMAARLPVDSFGVGTELATSADAPSLGVIYKMVELEICGIKRHVAKFSEDKHTYPGSKQVFRFPDHDEIACSWECRSGPGVEALLKPVLLGGNLLEELPDANAARERASASVRKLPAACRSLHADENAYSVYYSPELTALYERVRKGRNVDGVAGV